MLSYNMRPAMKAIDEIRFTKLPARACILLWNQKPKSVKDTPDMTCYIELR